MFDGLFNQMFGPAKPADTHYKWDDRWWLLTAEHPTYAGVYYAVEAKGPDDRAVFGKPVVLVPHEPSLRKIRERSESAERSRVQAAFLVAVRESTPDVEVITGFLAPQKRKAWESPMPIDVAPINSPCGVKCPARWLSSRNAQSAPPSYVAPEHPGLLDTLCEKHRAMVDTYLKDNPDAWPPKPAGAL